MLLHQCFWRGKVRRKKSEDQQIPRLPAKDHVKVGRIRDNPGKCGTIWTPWTFPIRLDLGELGQTPDAIKSVLYILYYTILYYIYYYIYYNIYCKEHQIIVSNFFFFLVGITNISLVVSCDCWPHPELWLWAIPQGHILSCDFGPYPELWLLATSWVVTLGHTPGPHPELWL